MQISCKDCGSFKLVRNGKARKHQRYKCKEFGLSFIEGDRRQKTPVEAQALAVLLYGMEKSSYGFIAKLFRVSRTAVYHWIRNFCEDISPPQVSESLMKCGIISLQKNKLWIWKTLDRHEGKTLTWVTGDRNAKTFQSLYEKVKYVKGNSKPNVSNKIKTQSKKKTNEKLNGLNDKFIFTYQLVMLLILSFSRIISKILLNLSPMG